MHWDVPGLFRSVCSGLAEATRHAPDLMSIGVDSWAVDYGLLRDGNLLGLPYHYRDTRCDGGVDLVHARFRSEQIFMPATDCSSCRSTRCSSSPPTSSTARSTPPIARC